MYYRHKHIKENYTTVILPVDNIGQNLDNHDFVNNVLDIISNT